jgi:transposase
MTYRKQPKSPMERYSIRDFERDFPTDEACLEWLREYLYPDGIFCKVCQQVTKHHRVKSRPSYSCDRCGHHEHPTAGTIYHRSRTPLRLWFRAIFLMAQTRCGISAKAIERDLGVTYKTAWRMFHEIRALLNEEVTDLDGKVEI